MAKEFGQFFLGANDNVPLNAFVLNTSDVEIYPNENVKIEHLHPVYVTCEADLADKLIALGIIRRENIKGKDVLMMINPGGDVKI